MITYQTPAYRFSETITLHGVEIQTTGTYDPAEAATYDYPGSGIEVSPTTIEIGGVDVSALIDAGFWDEFETQLKLAIS